MHVLLKKAFWSALKTCTWPSALGLTCEGISKGSSCSRLPQPREAGLETWPEEAWFHSLSELNCLHGMLLTTGKKLKAGLLSHAKQLLSLSQEGGEQSPLLSIQKTNLERKGLSRVNTVISDLALALLAVGSGGCSRAYLVSAVCEPYRCPFKYHRKCKATVRLMLFFRHIHSISWANKEVTVHIAMYFT